MELLRFGALGAARITPTALLEPAASAEQVEVCAVAARDVTRAGGFAQEHEIARVHDTYDALVADPELDAVYIALPIAAHHEWAIKALRAGKHVLCEKSLASNAAQALEMAEVADAEQRVLMDAFHYRYHPLFERLVSLVARGELGELREIHASFCVPHGPEVNNGADIRRDYRCGGGVLMDIGCYPISWIRHVLLAQDLDNPQVRTASAMVCAGEPDDPRLPHLVDETFDIELFSGEVRATAHCSMAAECTLAATLEVIGTRGQLSVINPIAPQMGHSFSWRGSSGPERAETFPTRTSYAYQLEHFLKAVDSGAKLATDARDAVAQLAVIDACYTASGLPLRK